MSSLIKFLKPSFIPLGFTEAVKERVPVNFGQGLGHRALHVCSTQTDQNKGNCRGCAVDVSCSIESKKEEEEESKGVCGCSSPFGVEFAETEQV